MSCGHVVVTLARFCSRVVGPLDRSVRDSEAASGRGGRQMESSSNLIPSREAKQTATSGIGFEVGILMKINISSD